MAEERENKVLGGPPDDYEPMIQKKLENAKQSKVKSYVELFVGRKGFWALLKYEIIIGLFSDFPGALGIFFRSIFYRFIFKRFGKGAMIGRSVTLRCPYKISMGDNVIIDDNCSLDAKGRDNEGIIIDDGVYVGRNSIVSCKNGMIHLEKNVNIGFNCEVYSLNKVVIGANTLIAAYCYIVGGGHTADRTDLDFRDQEKHAYGIEIGKNTWLGAKSIILDNCNIGQGSIIGAAAVVNKNIPEFSIAAGIPARVIKKRK